MDKTRLFRQKRLLHRGRGQPFRVTNLLRVAALSRHKSHKFLEGCTGPDCFYNARLGYL